MNRVGKKQQIIRTCWAIATRKMDKEEVACSA